MPKGIRHGGRKKGTPNKRTLEVIAKAQEHASDGITPLEVIIGVMRRLWKMALVVDQDGKEVVDIDKAKEAAALAAAAAPYVHPRLQAIQHAPAPVGGLPANMSTLEYARRVAFTLMNGARLKALEQKKAKGTKVSKLH